MAAQIAEAVNSFCYGVAWAGIVMCYDFCMNKGNILHWWYDFLKSTLPIVGKALGMCPICFGFWCALFTGDFILIGVSQLILIVCYGDA